MVYNGQKQGGEDGAVSELVLGLVFPLREQGGQAHQSAAVDHEPTAQARQRQQDQVVFPSSSPRM